MEPTKPVCVTVTADVVDSAFVPWAPGRCALLIQAPVTNRVTLCWNQAAVLDMGINLYPGGPPLLLSREIHGALVNGPIRIISAVAAQSVSYIESVHPDKQPGYRG